MRKAISWRARVASAVRAALAGSLTLALCGCIFPPTLTSDTTTLPREARAIEPGLEGDFWLPEGPDGDARFEVATISRDADNRYHFVYRDESGDVSWSSDEDGAAAEVIRTRHPGIDVVMMQVDERTLYSLAFASRGGTWLLFPFIVLALFIITFAAAMLLSSLYVRFRDVGIIWSVAVTAIFYGTPVLYPLEKVPEQYVKWLLLNPLTPIFVQARHWVIDPSAPTAVQAAGGWLQLMPSILIFVAICVLAVWVFKREAPRIAEEL